MTNLPPRPTWKLGNEVLPASYPAAILDPEAAFAAALAAKAPYDRLNDVSDVTKAAVSYAAETMRDGVAMLAFMARHQASTPLVSEDGWMAFYEPGPSKTVIDLVLVNPVEPGAWHVSVHYDKRMTDGARARAKELEDQVHAARVAAGASDRDAHLAVILASIGGGKGDQTPEQKALKQLQSDPASYRDAQPGDELTRFCATALILDEGGWKGVGLPGYPRGTERSDSVPASKFLPIEKHGSVWWSGMEVIAAPQSSYRRHEQHLHPGSDRMGGSAHIPMTILSGLVRSIGQAGRVQEANRETGQRSWVSFGDSRSVLLQDAGMAVVAASGGFFDQDVADRIRDFSAGIAASDVARNMEDWFALVPRLEARGFTDASHRFDCNDMRDQSYAKVEEAMRCAVLETQHGTYRIDMHEDGEGGIARIEAFRVLIPEIHWNDPDRDEKRGELRSRDILSFDTRPVGRFVMTEEGLKPAYGATEEGQPAIDYTIRNVRDMNGIVASLSSTCCCFDEEYPEKTEDDDFDPAP